VNSLGVTQALPNKFYVPQRSGDAACRFLLKRMQDVKHTLKPNRVGGPVGIAVEVIPDLQDPAEALERLGVARMVA
jgi:hypothetical protein